MGRLSHCAAWGAIMKGDFYVSRKAIRIEFERFRFNSAKAVISRPTIRRRERWLESELSLPADRNGITQAF